MNKDQKRPVTPQGGRPTRAVSEQIERRILDAAALLLLRDGYEETSMDAVAAEAGISKRTIYTRFPAKSHLFQAVVGDVIEHKLLVLKSTQGRGASLAEQLLALTEDLHAIVLAPEIIRLERVVIAESMQFPELARRLHQRMGEVGILLVRDVIRPVCARYQRDAELLHRDCRIFLTMVLLVPLRNAVLGRAEQGVAGVDRDFLKRAVEVFVKGIQPDEGPSSPKSRKPGSEALHVLRT